MDTEKAPSPAPVEPVVSGPTSPEPRRRWFLNWKVLTVPCLVVVGVIALESLRGSSPSAAAASAPMIVPVAKVVREDLAQDVDFDAEFRPYQEIDLHAKVAGFVQSITVDIGDRVKQGDVLATLEIPELKEDLDRAAAVESRNEKEIGQAQAKFDDVHVAYTRLADVNKSRPNLIAQQDLDTAQARDHEAEAELDSAKQQVQVSKAELDKLRAVMDYCKITAPFSGVITKRYADEGALVQGGVTPSAAAMPLVRLSQNDRLRLDFPVSVSYVHRINVGDPVEIRIQALGRTISGKISRFTRKVNTDTRTMEAEVDVPNPDLSLTPGVYAVAALKLDRREKVLTIPEQAVSGRSAPTVFVINRENEIEERPVTLGLETPDKFEVISGLKENEMVLLGSRAQVRPGQKVEPKLAEQEAVQVGSAQ